MIGIRRVVDELAPLFEPAVDRAPWDMHETRRIRFRLAGKVSDRIGRERIAERMIAHNHPPADCTTSTVLNPTALS